MFETVKAMLVKELNVSADAIKPEAELSADLGINSIELANLVMLCEDKFGVTIEDEDIHKFITVGDVVTFLEENNK
ncbi:MAG: acyl carrier protein [Clostridia bacterium]|nr:acyl carrier protein [Clostridia bacterium]